MTERPYSCSIQDACQISGIGRTEIYQLINAEKIRVVYHGSKPLVIVDSLIAYVDSLPLERAKASA